VGITVDELTVADEPKAWTAIGFAVHGRTCTIGDVRVHLAGVNPEGDGLIGWSLRGIGTTDLDGLSTAISEREPPEERPTHPNGVTAVDHVVAVSPAFERTVTRLETAGLDLRRIREETTPAGAPRQAFFRLGATILEVVEEPAQAVGCDRPAFFWGVALIAPELDQTVARFGDRVSEVRPAVQPGRRIATLRRSAGLSLPVALMTPADRTPCR
jgi:hypothetical protein